MKGIDIRGINRKYKIEIIYRPFEIEE